MSSPTPPAQEPFESEHVADAASTTEPEDAAATTGPDGAVQERRAVPSQEELERVAVEVRIRRRPRFGVFITSGIVIAALLGYVLAASVPQQQHVNWGSTVWVMTLGSAVFGALLGAGAGVFADWRSRRK